MRIVVIGGVAGGMSAAAKARRTNKDAEIVVFEKGRFVSYGACGMPYFLSGEIESYEELIVRKPEDFEKAGIKVNLGWEAKEIDAKNFKVIVESREGKREEVSFDSLVIATGASSRRLPIEGVDLKGVFTLKSLDDGIAIKNYISDKKVKRAAVIGAGFIGLELIDAFVRQGIEVVSIDIVPSPPPQFDDDMVDFVKEKADENKVITCWGSKVDRIEGGDSVEAVVIEGERFPVDMVVLSVGVSPNSEIAERAGIELSVANAIKVDERMQTSVEGIYAAGDCTHSYSVVTGKPIYLPLGSLANRHGRVAGTNAAGKNAVMHPVAGSSIVKFFDIGLARAGLTESEAKSEGFDVASVVIKAYDKAHYYPGAGKMKVKLVWDKASGRLLGAQLAGPYTGVKRIDVVASLLIKRATVSDLKSVDLAYAPPFSPVWDPLSIAANQAVKD